MQRLTAFVLLLALIVPLAAPAAARPVLHSAAKVSLTTETPAVLMGETLAVSIRVDGMQDIQGIEAALTFDPGRLQAVRLDVAPVFDVQIPVTLDNQQGRVHLAVASRTPQSGTAVVGTVTFRAMAPGSATVALVPGETLLGDADANVFAPVLGPNLALSVARLEFRPVPPSLVNTPALTVVGTYDGIDSAAVQVAVNDGPPVAATVHRERRQWEAAVNLAEGENTLTVSLVGVKGSIGTRVVLDTLPPEVRVTSPLDGQALASPLVVVTGTVVDMGSGVAEVQVAGVPAQVDATGSFRAEVDLGQAAPDGLPLSIAVVVRDRAGNVADRRVTVVMDRTGPQVVETDPVDGVHVGTARPAIVVVARDALSAIDPDTLGVTVRVGGAPFTDFTPQVSAAPDGKTLVVTIGLVQDLPVVSGVAGVEVSVTLRDTLGNETRHTFRFTVDVTFPVPAVAVAGGLAPNERGWFRQALELTLAATPSAPIRYRLQPADAPPPASEADLLDYTPGTRIPVGEGQFRLYVATQNPSTGRWSPVQVLGPAPGVDAFRVDQTAPPAPEVNVQPANREWLRAGDTLQVTVATEPGATATARLAYRKKAGNEWIAQDPLVLALAPAAEAGRFTGALPIAADAGEWKDLVLEVTVTDPAGNERAVRVPVPLGVDTVPPWVLGAGFQPHGILSEREGRNRLTVVAAAEPGLKSVTYSFRKRKIPPTWKAQVAA